MVHTATLEQSVDICSRTSTPPGMSATSRCASPHVLTGYTHSIPSGQVRIATVRTFDAAAKVSSAALVIRTSAGSRSILSSLFRHK
ncbi:hypothetical protein ACFY2J_39020 [Streptomyces collinus]|uniref:hypothetical protein n=1 Tax=Streptomyces collinus TaxID=42684 RepID=UPI00368CD9CB